jgi:NADPH:quinone reductase-like Zn-dependent oxidoreductase
MVGPVRHGGSEPVTFATMLWTARLLSGRLLGNAWRGAAYAISLSFDRGALSAPELAAALASGALRVRRHPRLFTLEQLGAAHEACEGSTRTAGKIVVRVAPGAEGRR